MDRQGVGRVCLALKGVTPDHPWGEDHDAYKVGGKMFALIGALGGLSFKASDIAFEVLTQSRKARPAPYLARAKWGHLDGPNDWPDDELADHLQAAHTLIAAKLTKKVGRSWDCSSWQLKPFTQVRCRAPTSSSAISRTVGMPISSLGDSLATSAATLAQCVNSQRLPRARERAARRGAA